MGTLRVLVPTMSCRHCVRTVSQHVRDVPGVVAIIADAEAGVVVLQGSMSEADVLAALRDAGFPASALSG